ncbi:CcdB family protein [Zoogloea sp.]|uniref:CcdB family protein n=1 Tax=Zoogloea sp. TaxID=49181 RepID=UPI0025E370EB|nr:CcdB family protein [Zoogloea sp.]MCK6396161.1 CcdB family protein [Zoogloea sp.]
MSQYTVYKNPEGRGYLLDLQAGINSHFSTRVVAPLFLLEEIPVFAKGLNPVFEVEGQRVVMMTQGMAAVPVQMLKQPVMSLADRRVEIVAALDLLFQGF